MILILQSFIVLVFGFLLLIKGADYFVEGSSSTAKMLKVPSVIIGLTVVAMGTSLPECAVSVTAALAGNNELAISNVVGSNIFNLLVVCGFCALFNPLSVEKNTLKKEFPFSMLCVLVLFMFGFVLTELGHTGGLLLLFVFAGFIICMVGSALKARSEASEEKYEYMPLWKCSAYIIGGCIAIKFGGDFVVNGASSIAAELGLSSNLIGLTIIACGTSLPELVTSVVAARKNELEMAVGNVIGSNIFNILFVLGAAAAISPIAFIAENIIDIVLLIFVSFIVWIFAWSKHQIDKTEGTIMLGMYGAYLTYICVR